MKSLKELYKKGRGPSSSHTMGPEAAAKLFKNRYPNADKFKVVLYESLAKTGKGHRTDTVIKDTLALDNIEIIFDEKTPVPHPNTMDMHAFLNGEEIGSLRIFSIGGGSIEIAGENYTEAPDIYDLSSFEEISQYCRKKEIRIWQYVEEIEGPEIWDYLRDAWETMKQSIREGLQAEGELEGGLHTQRKAKFLYNQRHIDESSETRENRLVCAYAFAVSEQNASRGTVVTAPTCGSCGVMPAVLFYMQNKRGFSDKEIIHALATGGIIGNLIKTNASISGAECGCQAEVGSACAMAAAALGELFSMDIDQIEYAAEISIEHHLGLTCDPINGLVQIPCIERNAVAAMRAINALNIANFLTHTRKISFDMVVDTMYETGKDLAHIYRETSEGGLAKKYKQNL